MEVISTAAAIMGGLGLFFGAVLAIAYRFLRVEEDPRIDQVDEMLPGNNCGACGEPGCHAFAEALIEGRTAPGKCTVSTADGIGAIADFLGVDPGSAVKQVARLHCAGGRGRSAQVAAYEGFESCRAATLVAGGGKGCAWGCLGLADCEVACTFDAIHMNDLGLPVVDPVLCTACGDCVDECPKDLFELLPIDQPLLVQCKIPLSGDEAKALCNVACDACGRCAQDAAPKLITMVDNLPVIDYAAGLEGDPRATMRCPTGAITWLIDRQFADTEIRPIPRERHVTAR